MARQFTCLALLVWVLVASNDANAQVSSASHVQFGDSRLFLRLGSSTHCQRPDCDEALARTLHDAAANWRPILPVARSPVPVVKAPARTGQSGSAIPLQESAAMRLGRTYVIDFDGARISAAALRQQLVAHHTVEWVEFDAVGRGAADTPSDPAFAEQWALEQDSDVDIDVLLAWGLVPQTSDVVIAILDTGVGVTHPDIEGKIVSPRDVVWDDTDPDDDHGHGTNIAGIALATADNGIASAGVCTNCRLMPVKVLDRNNFGFYSWWVDGILFAVDNGADIINFSAGGLIDSPVLADAVEYAADNGVVVVAAMMNTGESQAWFPAALPQTIAVGATDRQDARAVPFDFGGGSNYGAHIDLVAPGVEITGSAPDGGADAWSGTSQATALVSGTVGLMLSVDPTLDPDAVRDALRNSAVDQVGQPQEDAPGWDPYHGAGRLDAFRALVAVGNFADSDGDGYPDSIDCEPFDLAVHPEAPELPDNGVDDDCDPDTRDNDAAEPEALEPMEWVDVAETDAVESDPPFPRTPGRSDCSCGTIRSVETTPLALMTLLLCMLVWGWRKE